MKILEMLESGKITSDEATQLLKAVGTPEFHTTYPEEPVVFEQPFSETLPVQEETDIDISHSHGHISVKGWDKEEVKLEGKKIVRAADRETARMYAEQMKVEITSNEHGTTVRTIRPEPEESWRIRDRTINYELYAPHRFNVTLQSAHGRVLAGHFSGSLDINGEHGPLQVEDMGENTSIQHAHGHVEVSRIAGDASVRKTHGNLKLKEVGGKLKLDHEHGHVEVSRIVGDASVRKIHGNLKLKEADGKLKLDHEHGHVDLTTIGKCVDLTKRHGNINIDGTNDALQIDHDHGHLQLHGIGGDVEVKKSHGNADIEDVRGRLSFTSQHGHLNAIDIRDDLYARGSRGRVSIENISGSADIVYAQGQVRVRNVQKAVSVRSQQGNVEVNAPHPVVHPYRLHAEHANLTLLIPEDAQVDISAQTEHGRIHSELPLTIEKKGHVERVEESLNGGGTAFELLNHHGNIRIETSGVSDEKQ